MSAAVRIVAVNYRGAACVATLLATLRVQTCADWALTIVDNSCDPGEVERLRELAGDRAQIAVAPRNLGYFGAADWWRTQQDGPIPQWTVVCNVDLELAGDFVERLLAGDVGQHVTAPGVHADPLSRQQNPYLLARPTRPKALFWAVVFHWPLTARLYARAASAVARRRPVTPAGPARDIYAAHGSIMALHRRFFVAGGSLAHGAFLFGEEITIAEQVRRFGGTIRFDPTVRAVHREHQATGTVRSRQMLRRQREGTRNTYRLIRGG